MNILLIHNCLILSQGITTCILPWLSLIFMCTFGLFLGNGSNVEEFKSNHFLPNYISLQSYLIWYIFLDKTSHHFCSYRQHLFRFTLFIPLSFHKRLFSLCISNTIFSISFNIDLLAIRSHNLNLFKIFLLILGFPHQFAEELFINNTLHLLEVYLFLNFYWCQNQWWYHQNQGTRNRIFTSSSKNSSWLFFPFESLA